MITIKNIKRSKSIEDNINSDTTVSEIEKSKYLSGAESDLIIMIQQIMEQYGYECEISSESDTKITNSPENSSFDPNY